MATDLIQIVVGQSEPSVVFLSVPSGQGAFQSCKGGNDDVPRSVGYQVSMQVGDKTLPLMESQPLIKNSQIGWFGAKKEQLGCLAST